MPNLLLLPPLVRVHRRRALTPLPLAIDDRNNVQEAHDSCANRVRDDRAASLANEFQSKTAVDHAKNDSDAADTDVRVRHRRATAVLLERAVVQPSAKRLSDEENEQHDADNGVRLREVVAIDGDPDANAESSDVNEEAQDLQSGVHPDEAGEAGDADQDAADGEESDEGERGHDAVGEEQGLG